MLSISSNTSYLINLNRTLVTKRHFSQQSLHWCQYHRGSGGKLGQRVRLLEFSGLDYWRFSEWFIAYRSELARVNGRR